MYSVYYTVLYNVHIQICAISPLVVNEKKEEINKHKKSSKEHEKYK